MSIPGRLIGVECVSCRRKGHSCQAQMIDDGEPSCLRCANDEPCYRETSDRFSVARLADPVDPCDVPVVKPVPPRLKHSVYLWVPIIDATEASQIRRELAEHKVEEVAKRHGLDRCMVAQYSSEIAAPQRRMSAETRRRVARKIRRRETYILDGEEVRIAPGAQMGAEMTGLREVSPSERAVLRVVSEYFGVEVNDLKNRSHAREVVLRRQVAMFLLQEVCGEGISEIGRCFKVHHTTALHSVRVIAAKCEVNSELRNIILTLKSALGAD